MGDYRTTSGEALPPPLSKRKRKIRRGGIALAIVLAVLLIAGLTIHMPRYVSASGYVATREHAEIRPPHGGRVAAIKVRSGDDVTAGQILVRLDNAQEMASASEAKAILRRTEAEAARRRIEIAERKRQIEEERAIAALRAQNAEKKLARSRELLKEGLVPGSVVEDLELEREVARSVLASLESRDLSAFDREVEALEQDVQARRDAYEQAALRVAERNLHAPISGHVLRYEFTEGELVRPETLLFEVFGGDQTILKVKVPERFAARIGPGQRCTAVLLPFRSGTVIFEGEVEHVRNVIQGEGDRTYRVAYCHFDPQGLTIPPGTTARARIYYGRSSVLHWVLGFE